MQLDVVNTDLGAEVKIELILIKVNIKLSLNNKMYVETFFLYLMHMFYACVHLVMYTHVVVCAHVLWMLQVAVECLSYSLL